jgi:hypothetical protein
MAQVATRDHPTPAQFGSLRQLHYCALLHPTTGAGRRKGLTSWSLSVAMRSCRPGMALTVLDASASISRMTPWGGQGVHKAPSGRIWRMPCARETRRILMMPHSTVFSLQPAAAVAVMHSRVTGAAVHTFQGRSPGAAYPWRVQPPRAPPTTPLPQTSRPQGCLFMGGGCGTGVGYRGRRDLIELQVSAKVLHRPAARTGDRDCPQCGCSSFQVPP